MYIHPHPSIHPFNPATSSESHFLHSSGNERMQTTMQIFSN
jgi:hypothetical protein